MTIPLSSTPRRPTARQSTLLVDWRAEDLRLDARTGQVLAYTRAGPGAVVTHDGRVAMLPYGMPRFGVLGGEVGLLVEPTRTNLAKRSNDFSHADWTKSNLTATAVATGPDGVANSASRLAATAGNATALQAITSASAARVTSMYVRRVTGTGAVQMTQNNGSTWTPVTVTTAWALVEIPVATAANPTVGIRIVASGDVIEVAYFQHEVGSYVTSPIVTAGAGVARVADRVTVPIEFGSPCPANLTVYARIVPLWGAVAAGIGGDAYLLTLGGSTPQLSVRRDSGAGTYTALLDTATTDASASASAAVTAVQTILAQFAALRTAPTVAIDAGAGLSAHSSAGTAITAFGSSTLTIGGFSTVGELGGLITHLKIANDLDTLANMAIRN